MKTLKSVLTDNSVTPAGMGWKLPVANGRFVLTESFDVIDTGAGNTYYARDTQIALGEAMINVPNLTTEPTNVSYLFAHAVKPIVGLTDAQVQAKTNFLPKFVNDGLNKEAFEAADVFWMVPDGGVELSAGKLIIPGFGKYYVDSAAWTLNHVADDSPVVPGTNRGNSVVLIDDQDKLAEVDAAMIIFYAAGKLKDPANIDKPVYFVDYDATNLDPDNMTLTPHLVDDATTAITDISTDFVIQDGDGQLS